MRHSCDGYGRVVRSILVAENHPWPPLGGIALRNAANAAALARMGPTALVGVGDPVGPRRSSPLAESEAVGLGHPPVVEGDDTWRTRPEGHPSDGRWDETTEWRWRAFLRRWRPDVVVVEQLWLHRALGAARELGIATVLDAHNVERSVYAAIAAAAGPDDRAARDMAERTARLEAATLAEVDQVWTCTQHDCDELAAAGRGHVVPNAVDTKTVAVRGAVPHRPHLVLTASFAYPPNVDAARTVLNEVLPRFSAAVGPARLSLVGRDPPCWLREVGRTRHDVEVTGAVASTLPWLRQATATVIALRAGSGTRFKVLEALAAGVPVISTPKGVEGLDVEPGRHVLVSSESHGLADLAAAVHRGAHRDLVREGRRLVVERYSWDTVDAAVATALAAMGTEGRFGVRHVVERATW
jgi:glycosyltransferase involved in cell wall biosynthesis